MQISIDRRINNYSGTDTVLTSPEIEDGYM